MCLLLSVYDMDSSPIELMREENESKWSIYVLSVLVCHDLHSFQDNKSSFVIERWSIVKDISCQKSSYCILVNSVFEIIIQR